MKRVPLICLALAIPVLLLALSFGCSEKSNWSVPSVMLESIPTTIAPRIDGDAFDREWLSAPELLIAMSDKNGNLGGNFYLKMKSVYTVYPDTVYFLLQWADTTDDVLPDRLFYIGEPWQAKNCRVTEELIDPANWIVQPSEYEKEDRFCLMFEITPVSDETGTFASRGCQTACHGRMNPPAGKLDVWYWMRARTDAVSRCDDMVTDSLSLRGDSGEGIWRTNRRDGTFVPKYIPRWGNGDLSPAKFVYDPGPWGQIFNPCDTVNPASLLPWNDPRDPEPDYVPSYVVKFPAGSRGDVKAKGEWDEGRWTVELRRAMRTGQEAEDVAFYIGRSYNFAVAIMNGSRTIHSGSVPLVLKFRQ
ncbi:MAG: hypothetical protein AMJ46_13765 [Latescibacteria bacterium DG_63]|nr:MAG: hypothetical protein AMJ46_13765 [Latescibacteria bacterium DG_63]